VAYRQLCSVTFAVFGLAAFGCGADGNSTASSNPSTTTEQAPANSDQPPSGSDQAAASAETPPSNPDSPPPSLDTPGGGLSTVCKQLCSSLDSVVDHCSQGLSRLGMGDLCSGAEACQVPASALPCANQIVGLFQCFTDNIELLCTAGGQNNSGDQPAARPPTPCDDVLQAFSSCADAGQVDDNNDSNPPGDCSTGSACVQCVCKAGSDAKKLQDCATGDCAP